MATFSDYYRLTKPGIIKGNLIHVLAGALLAAHYGLQFQSLFGVLLGTSLIIASACVANNYIDRDIDGKMTRTKKRASVTGKISLRSGMIFLAALLAAGVTILMTLTNLTVLVIGLTAYVFYVFFYALAKRRTVHSTLVGSIPGALPAMAGYVAVSGFIDTGAWLVFLLIICWQMPHFYAISVFRRSDYKAANIPVLGAIAPFYIVKRFILAYILLYSLVVTLMISAEVIGAPAGLLLIAGCAYWLFVFFTAKGNAEQWARSIFGASLLLTLLFLVAATLNIIVGPGSTLQ